jgi:polyhydroxyalkanoate synthase
VALTAAALLIDAIKAFAGREQDAPYVGPDQWLKSAPRTGGSWWPEWTRWLATKSGELCDPPQMGMRPSEDSSLPDAPGDYVHQ